MIGAGRAERRELLQTLRAHELQDPRIILEVADLGLDRADPAADARHQVRRTGTALVGAERFGDSPAERLADDVGVKPVLRLLNDPKRGLLAGLGVAGPGEQAVPAEHDADILRIRVRQRLELQAEALEGPPRDADPLLLSLGRAPADLIERHRHELGASAPTQPRVVRSRELVTDTQNLWG